MIVLTPTSFHYFADDLLDQPLDARNLLTEEFWQDVPATVIEIDFRDQDVK